MAELDHFAIMSFDKRHFTNAFIVRVSTNNPIHLALYYTTRKPLRHKVERILSGLATMWGAYFCFIGWKFIPQIEAGDTLNHTFIVPDQSYLSKLWYTFRGTIAGQLSPSCGPIIEHYQPAGDIILNPSFETFTAPPNPPNNWSGGGIPALPPRFYPDTSEKTDGGQSCRAEVHNLNTEMRLYQWPIITYLSNLTLDFRVSYRGELTWWNWLRIRAYGDVTRIAYARPALNYQWENLTATITMPNNLYNLRFELNVHNQGEPLPFKAWWDKCQIFLWPAP